MLSVFLQPVIVVPQRSKQECQVPIRYTPLMSAIASRKLQTSPPSANYYFSINHADEFRKDRMAYFNYHLVGILFFNP